MKTTIVPAQITTVEDKIAGNLNFTQLLLLTTPVFLSGAIFALIPPIMNFRSYKLVTCLVIAVICLTLSIRVKGKIVLTWIAIVGRYNLRPRHYVYDKNDLHLRPIHAPSPQPKAEAAKKAQETEAAHDPSVAELIRAESATKDPRARFEFRTTRKGGLRVYIQEIK